MRDSGTGIPQGELEQIFDRFYRVEGARGRSHEGTGIGLALVQELVKLHGGTVAVESVPGEGTTFTVRLLTGSAHVPNSRVTAEARTLVSTGIGADSFLSEASRWDHVAADSLPPASEGTEVRAQGTAHRTEARILVADDNADLRLYITRLLSPHWTVDVVSDGAQALAAARKHPPDLVVSDVMMPGLDGLSLVRALRSDERTRTIPVMLLSARAGEAATITGLESGADDYLVKPFSSRELLARVNAQLTVSRLRQEAVRAARAHAEESGRLLAEAVRATRAREETLAIVSHDLRTPLGAIRTAADVLHASMGQGGADPRARQATDVIRRSADGMNRLLGDLLDVASIDAGRLSLDLSRHGPEALIRVPLEPASRTVPSEAALAHAPRGPAAVSPHDADNFVQRGGESGRLIRSFDWSTTCLGPMADWPSSLRTSVSTMLRSPYPITLFWGRDLVMLYNDPFRPIHGDKHPGTMGASAPRALAEAWTVLGPLVEKTLASGEPMYVENGLVMFARRAGGLKEESYFTWSYNPTIGESGEVAGLFAIASETTRQVLGDRRLLTLRELSLRTAFDRKVEGVYRSVDDVLAQAGADVPFALLYVVDADHAELVSCAGVTRGTAAAPMAPRLESDAAWPLGNVARSGMEEVVEDLDAGFGPLPGGPWPEPATRALVLQVPMGADTGATAVLVVGLSPLLPLDDDYRSFLQLLARQISASISSARAYEQETQRAEQLAELDRAKTSFFSNVSHELRTPLTLILGPVEDALSQPTKALSGKSLELVRRNALRLYKMVNTLLDFARVEAGRARATFVPTDLAAFTRSLASHFQSAAERAGLVLTVDCPPLSEAIYVDPEMWEKIVLNLLSNAIKYTHKGQIRVGLAWKDDMALLTVQDTGVGIAEDEQSHVFERFYRAREGGGRSHEGTGIGLALARELVELHGGSVGVESTLGVGTTFTVRMPRGTAHLPAERIERAARPRSSAAGAAAFVEEASRWSGDAQDDREELASDAAGLEETTAMIPSRLASSRILLVDDNADLRTYVAGVLGRSFPNVESATNGRQALERARAHPPDLILSDVMMPVMDGFTLVRALRADERTRSVPIILLSARAGDEATVEGLDSGADDYLVKPFSARELMARVRGQLEMARIRAEVWAERGHVEELRRSVTARDEFISISAHELRTPLTALQIQIESLLNLAEKGRLESSPERVVGKVTVALRQVEKMARLVESLLDVSRLSLGAFELAPSEFDLAELARTVVGPFENDVRASGGGFRVEAMAVRGRWDEARIGQVLTGLLSNAVKYAPGTVIDLRVEGEAEVARVIVRDSGRGIPEEARSRLFERFERAVSADNYGGFGVGLYVSRMIVEAHGGTIEALPTQGPGTTIVVTLPRWRGEPKGLP